MSEWPITIVRMGADVDFKGDPIEYDWWHEIPAEKVDHLLRAGFEVVTVVPAPPEQGGLHKHDGARESARLAAELAKREEG